MASVPGRLQVVGVMVLCTILSGCNATNDKRHVYDLTPAVEASYESMPAAAPSKATAALVVDSSMPDPRYLGYSHRMDHLQIRLGLPPVLNAEADRDITEYLRSVTERAMQTKGVTSADAESSGVQLRVLVTRLELPRPDPALGDSKRRGAVLEGNLSVVQDGRELYARRVAVAAERQFGSGSEAMGWIQGDLMVAAHNKEEDEGIQSLFTDLFVKYHDQITGDQDLWDAIHSAGVVTASDSP